MILLGAAVVVGLPVVAVFLLLLVADALQRRRDEVIARQIAVTDAIHAELGAIVAPVVRRARRGWRVDLPMAPEHPEASRALAIASHTLGGGAAVEVVVRVPAQNRLRMAEAMSS